MKNKEKCHICLDEKRDINQTKSCKNLECTGYICSSCWYDLHNNSIDVCPLCRETINYTLIQNIFNIKHNTKNIIKNIIIYLGFYSMGGSCFIAFNYLVNDITIENYITNNFQNLILSLILFPFIGFIIWYISILILAKIFLLKITLSNSASGSDSGSDSESDSDSDSDSDVNYFDGIF